MEPLFETSYVGFWIKVYANRVEFKAGAGTQNIPIDQIASIQLGMMGLWQITIETTGGKKYNIPTNKKKEVQEAIYKAQGLSSKSHGSVSVAEELTKLAQLKAQGILSEQEFEEQKKKLLQ